MRRKFQTRISDETGATLGSVVIYILKPGANIIAGGATSIPASTTGVVRVSHPGALFSGQFVAHNSTSDVTSATITVNSDPVYNPGGWWDVTLLNTSGSTVNIGSSGRLVADYQTAANWVDWYSVDTGGSATSGVISPNATTGELSFFADAVDVDLAITTAGTLSGYRNDLSTEDRTFVTPEEFGAIGDGVADDALALQKAVDFAAKIANLPVKLSGRTYYVASTVTISEDVVIEGSGYQFFSPGARTKLIRTGQYPIFHLLGTSSDHLHGTELRNMLLHGGGQSTAVLKSEYVSNSIFVDVQFASTDGRELELITTWDCEFQRCRFQTGGSATESVLYMSDANNIYFTECMFESMTGTAVTNDGPSNCNLIRFHNCKFESSATSSRILDLNSIVGLSFQGCIFSLWPGVSEPTITDYIHLLNCRWVSFDGEAQYIRNPGVDGPLIERCMILDSCEGVEIILFAHAAEKYSGSEIVQFLNNDSSKAHQRCVVNYLPTATVTAARHNLGLQQTQEDGFQFDGTTKLLRGSLTPEGAVTAPVGSFYMRTDGSGSNILYAKQTGTGNTGWVSVAMTSGFTATGDISMGGNDIDMAGGSLVDGANPYAFVRQYGSYEVSTPATTTLLNTGAYALMADTLVLSNGTSQFALSTPRITYTGSGTKLKVTITGSVNPSNTGHTVKVSCAKNATATGPAAIVRMLNAGLPHPFALTTILTIASGDVLDVRMNTDSGTNENVQLDTMSMTLEVVG